MRYAKKKKERIGVCPKCFCVRRLTRHHCHPLRFFNRGRNQSILYLCEDCHREIEQILPRYRKLTQEEYTNIHHRWIMGVPVIIY